MPDPVGRGTETGAGSRDPPDGPRIRAQFATADLPRHLALFYRTRAEQLATVSAFVERGLALDERVVYLADENEVETVVDALDATGIDVAACRDRGRLRVEDARAVYGEDTFDPARTVDGVESLAREAVEDGYAGLRLAGENTWSFEADCEFDSVIEFERDFDRRCPEFEVTALCQYSLDRFDDAAVGKALQTHEQVVYRGRLCENPYYVPPAEALEAGAPLSNGTLLLEQTRDVDRFERDIERREQRLSVVNRVLRHNLRNDLNVILGRLDWFERSDADPGQAEQIRVIRDAAERLLALSEKARHVDRTLESVDHGQVPLLDCIEETVDDLESELPDLRVTLERAPPDAAAAADSVVGLAIREVISVAAERLDDPSVTVSVRTDGPAGVATVDVAATDPFVSQGTRDTLRSGSEESLQHAVGLSMWVVKWVVESVNGSLRMPSDGPVDRIEFTVPTVPSSGPTDRSV
ncbi:MEDS domain-containing protein [Halosimplex halophilum]|uniref:MEDS domain-containing protein n=1 Tax=Halosimplex halophilum TaxID=2559572 RepID=UPI00107F9EFB|nr:MEDS domain-containing protein [Halosimplex halophilum]